MKILSTLLLSLFTIPLLTAGCDRDSRRLNEERRRRIHAEGWIRRAEGALSSCKQHLYALKRQQQQRRYRCRTQNKAQWSARVAALQRQIQQVRFQLAARNRQLQASGRQLYQCNRTLRTAQLKARGAGAVRIVAVRRHRGWLSPALRKRLSRPLPGLLQCYRRFAHVGNKLTRGAFWQIIATNTHGAHGAIAELGRMPSDPFAAFRRCVAGVLNRQRAWKTTRPARFALLVVFAPKAAELRTVARPAFRWPLKPLSAGKYARAGQVCRLGSRALQLRGHGALSPLVSRPCAPGLKCCYPCGIQGCNSVCKKDCGPPVP